MKKAIIIIRESTKAQEIDSQKQDIINYAIRDGYSLEEILIIGEAGASAIKLDETYLRNMQKVYDAIDNPNNSIECVYAWAIDRIGRNEEVLHKLKNYLVEKKIQLIIKKPSLKLLEDDGSVNSGVELAFSLFATMSKQEMDMKVARFKRGKRRNAEEMKFNGGWCTKFGYKVDSNGYIVINQAEADLVRLVFTEFANGKYSVGGLTKELRNRGIVKPNGDKLTFGFIRNMLSDTAYIGYVDDDKKRSHRKYPIISEVVDLWEKVQVIKQRNNTWIEKNNKYCHLGLKIVKCKECGYNYTVNGYNYRCWNHFQKYILKKEVECNNSVSMNTTYLDELLWDIASIEHADYITNFKDSSIQEIEYKIFVNNQKIEELLNKINDIGNKRIRINDLYVEGEIDKKTYKQKLDTIKKDNEIYNSERDRLIDINESCKKQIEDLQKADEVEAFLDQVLPIFGMSDKKQQYEIVHRHIKECYLERCKFDNKRATKIYIYTKRGTEHIFYWLPRFSRFYKYNEFTEEITLYRDYRKIKDEYMKYREGLQKEVDNYLIPKLFRNTKDANINKELTPEQKFLKAIKEFEED